MPSGRKHEAPGRKGAAGAPYKSNRPRGGGANERPGDIGGEVRAAGARVQAHCVGQQGLGGGGGVLDGGGWDLGAAT